VLSDRIEQSAGAGELTASRSFRQLVEVCTKLHYIEPDENVNPVTAEILESLGPRKPEERR